MCRTKFACYVLMLNIFKSALFHFICPICVRCGSFQVLSHFFCRWCTHDFLIQQLQKTSTSTNDGVEVHSFLTWTPRQSDSLSEFVYLLKSRVSQSAWTWIVQQIQGEICEVLDSSDSVLFIPVPGSRQSFHTEFFSGELQQFLGGQRKNVLRHKSAILRPQKSKIRADRNRIQFCLDEEFTHGISSVDHIVLVDDIYTTGSTLAAAANAIKNELKLKDIKTVKISGLVLFRRDKSNMSE
jgi:predicted amidophosphoribosyltransferase